MNKFLDRRQGRAEPEAAQAFPISTPDEDLLDLLAWVEGDPSAEQGPPAELSTAEAVPGKQAGKIPSIPATQKSPTSFRGLPRRPASVRPSSGPRRGHEQQTTLQHEEPVSGGFRHSLDGAPGIESLLPLGRPMARARAHHELKNPVFPANPKLPELAHTLRGARLTEESDWELFRPPVDPDEFTVLSSMDLERDHDDEVTTDRPPSPGEPSIVPSLRAQHLSTADGVHSLHNVQACFDRRDFEGALALAEAILDIDTYNFQARRYVESCRQVLEREYTARLSPLHRRLQARFAPSELPSLALNHRAGFMLSLIDGDSTIEDLLDMSAMPRLDALRILVDLVRREIVDTEG